MKKAIDSGSYKVRRPLSSWPTTEATSGRMLEAQGASEDESAKSPPASLISNGSKQKSRGEIQESSSREDT